VSGSLGCIGLLATNTIAQGETREVGLDQLAGAGWAVYRAWKSRPWPGDASIEVAEIWLKINGLPECVLDGLRVEAITSALSVPGRVEGRPFRLVQLKGRALQGFILWGDGFILSVGEAEELLSRDDSYGEVVFPFLNRDDLNSRADQSPSRWVISFHDWPLERAEQYPLALEIVRQRVKPIRDQVKRRRARERWWLYGETRPGLVAATAPLARVVAIALTSRTLVPAFVSARIIFSHAVGVFTYDDPAHLGLLSSAFHRWWALTYGSTMRSDLRYTPTDCFETFPQPDALTGVGAKAHDLNEYRREMMLNRHEGLTKTYNRVHDTHDVAADVVGLRRLHMELDDTVAAAYGWTHVDLAWGFHETPQGTRFTVAPEAQHDILDQLLELNHERHAAEVRAGLAK
jgi:hypothetical protein